MGIKGAIHATRLQWTQNYQEEELGFLLIDARNAFNGPPWAAYRAMMSCRLIVLEKSPGIRPVGIGETWRRLLAKCLLRVTGQEAKAACGTEHLEGGAEAGIEGAIHATRL